MLLIIKLLENTKLIFLGYATTSGLFTSDKLSVGELNALNSFRNNFF